MASKRRSMVEFLNLSDAHASPITDGLKRDLPIEQLVPRRNQPRSNINAAELEQMAATIRVLGIIQPIVVRPLAGEISDDNSATDNYEIIAGERRWRAAQRAGKTTVPVIIRTLDEGRAALYSLAENIARSDLNPMELAKGYSIVLQEHGFSQTELAEAIGQNVKTVNRIIRLLKLPKPVQEFLEGNLLTAKHGELLLGLPRAQQLELAKCAAEGEWSVRELERHIARVATSTQTTSSTAALDPDVEREQTLWCEQLGADVRLRSWKTGKVQITITVSSLDEYQGIRKRLGIID